MGKLLPCNTADVYLSRSLVHFRWVQSLVHDSRAEFPDIKNPSSGLRLCCLWHDSVVSSSLAGWLM